MLVDSTSPATAAWRLPSGRCPRRAWRGRTPTPPYVPARRRARQQRLLALAPGGPARQVVMPLGAVGRLQIGGRQRILRLARAPRQVHDPQRAVHLQIVGHLVPAERAVIGVERFLQLAARHQERDHLGVGAAAVGQRVDGLFERGDGVFALAQLIEELGLLHPGIGGKIRPDGIAEERVPIGQRRVARRLRAVLVVETLEGVGELAPQLGAL